MDMILLKKLNLILMNLINKIMKIFINVMMDMILLRKLNQMMRNSNAVKLEKFKLIQKLQILLVLLSLIVMEIVWVVGWKTVWNIFTAPQQQQLLLLLLPLLLHLWCYLSSSSMWLMLATCIQWLLVAYVSIIASWNLTRIENWMHMRVIARGMECEWLNLL